MVYKRIHVVRDRKRIIVLGSNCYKTPMLGHKCELIAWKDLNQRIRRIGLKKLTEDYILGKFTIEKHAKSHGNKKARLT
jgi:hypothetical protein